MDDRESREQPKWKHDYSALDRFIKDETDRKVMNEIKMSLEEDTDEEREILISELVEYLTFEEENYTAIGLEMPVGDQRLGFQQDVREALERAQILLNKKKYLKSTNDDNGEETEWLNALLKQHTVSQKDIDRINTMWTAWRQGLKDLFS